jgi:hypothetical protein
MKKLITRIMLLILCTSVITAEAKRKKKPRFKPYYMVTAPSTNFDAAVSDTRKIIAGSSFRLVGEYSPMPGRTIFAITNDTLLAAAAKTEFGGYGAVIRVAVTNSPKGPQVSYVNPTYMGYSYQMKDLSAVATATAELFGEAIPFGAKKGETKRSLKGYHYMMMMPYFEDHIELASFDSHQQALTTINANLSSGKHQLRKVFEVAIPGKDEVLIGVGIAEGDGADQLILNTIDKNEKKHTAYLPYAILVSGDTAYNQAGEFRIALAFPDLGMGQFMDISDAPDEIVKALKKLTKK